MDIPQFLIKTLLWLLEHYIEVAGTITGLIYLVYSVRGSILLWPFGILTSALYIYVFFVSKFYADMGLNVYYLVISVYGWIHWAKGGSSEQKAELAISRVTVRSALWYLLWTGIFFVIIAFVLKDFTDSPVPFWDAFTTAASIVATYMLARKIMEHWLIWIVVDAVSAGLYIYKGLYPTVLLFAVYTTLAVTGYFEWKRQWIKENQPA